RVRSEAVDGFRALPHGGLEIGGVLFGIGREGAARISAHLPLACEHALGPGFILSERDAAGLEKVLANGEPQVAGLLPVGWYRSRTRGEAWLSDGDRELHARYFPESWQVLLVLRPEHSGLARAACFSAGPDGTLTGGAEFVLAPTLRGAGPRLTPGPEAPQPLPVPLPAFLDRVAEPPRPRNWRGTAIVLALLSAAAGIAGFTYGTRAVPASAQDLQLSVVDAGGQLRISWDRNARPVQQSTRALLEIHDVGLPIGLSLDRDLLTKGSIAYVRTSRQVDVRMQVCRGNESVEDRVIFLGAPAAGR
ncbi:MAG TPA: hypothetical protein VF767_07925, partial [Bryobacteraceae bacterium]